MKGSGTNGPNFRGQCDRRTKQTPNYSEGCMLIVESNQIIVLVNENLDTIERQVKKIPRAIIVVEDYSPAKGE